MIAAQPVSLHQRVQAVVCRQRLVSKAPAAMPVPFSRLTPGISSPIATATVAPAKRSARLAELSAATVACPGLKPAVSPARRVIAETWLAFGELDGSYTDAEHGTRLLSVVLRPYLTLDGGSTGPTVNPSAAHQG
jgi:hypothetical protein